MQSLFVREAIESGRFGGRAVTVDSTDSQHQFCVAIAIVAISAFGLVERAIRFRFRFTRTTDCSGSHAQCHPFTARTDTDISVIAWYRREGHARAPVSIATAGSRHACVSIG
jgi:hypothetical protein